jgi:hypothetical protein
MLLGADVLDAKQEIASDAPPAPMGRRRMPRRWGSDFVLTRLHARYDKSSLGEDLVFAQAKGIAGGQGMPSNAKLDPDVREAGGWNSFQGRYAILHHWDGPARCARPLWDQWGGPPDGGAPSPAVAQQLAFLPRDAALSGFVSRSAHAQLALAGEPPPDDRPHRVQKAEAKAETKAAAGEKGCA